VCHAVTRQIVAQSAVSSRQQEINMSAAERRWVREFQTARSTIPADWIWSDPDGWQGIHPDHANDPRVRYYAQLCQVGYANGWL
jgi:hypothetical protein